MTDRYATLVRSGPAGSVAKRLGLPRPALLRRFAPDQPLVPGPVLVVTDSRADDDGDRLASVLLEAGLDVRRALADDGGEVGAVVVVLTGLASPTDLTAPALAMTPALKRLAASGRVVVVARAGDPGDTPAVAAARQAVDGFVRSVAKELRRGATANALLLAPRVPVTAPSAVAALRFLASTRSAFVDGQPLLVGSDGGSLDGDPWGTPLAGRVAAVTGAARGIGAEIARVLARDGARVVAVDVPAAGDALAGVANEVAGSALQLDVTAADAGARIAAHARSRHGRLDIVVHNAGITRDKLLANMDESRFASVLAVNVEAPLAINAALLESGLLADAPRIVALASTSGIGGTRGQTNYAASKAGVIGMVRATAPLLSSVGGTANAVAPGFIETDMTARMPLGARELARRLNSLQQGGLPVDVAETVAFLASPAAGGISGQTLRVCGQLLVGQ